MTKRNAVVAKLVAVYHNLSLRLFGNTVKLRINLLYVLYIWLVKVANILGQGGKLRVTEQGRQEAAAIRTHGFTKLLSVLPEGEVKAISDKVDQLFARDDKTMKTLEDGGLLRLKSCLIEVPELEKYILSPQVVDVIQGYFDSAYKVYSCDVYRTVPPEQGNPEDKFGSLKWHFDNCPETLLKIMVYLIDTNKENGALTVVDKQKSIDLKRRGFWKRDEAHRFADEIEQNARVLEAPAGTALLFSVHHCIHKATLPQVLHRDVAVFLVQPSVVQQQVFTPDERQNFSYNYGYCVNPFLGTPLRYGNE